MTTLYIRNLPLDSNDESLKVLFREHNLKWKTITVKNGGYAFVEFPNQCEADIAIDKLYGFVYAGAKLVVEPSNAGSSASDLRNEMKTIGYPGFRWAGNSCRW